jgi:hypothetical protein
MSGNEYEAMTSSSQSSGKEYKAMSSSSRSSGKYYEMLTSSSQRSGKDKLLEHKNKLNLISCVPYVLVLFFYEIQKRTSWQYLSF